MSTTEIQYVSDESGNAVSVIIPVDLWREIESERETAYLLSSDKMRSRLMGAINRKDEISFEEVQEKLGI